MKATAGVFVRGHAVILIAESYIDCGISQADIKPIRYENGEVMLENGKIYLTMSIRLEELMIQGVFSWVPGTAELEMTGVLSMTEKNDSAHYASAIV